MVDIDWILDDDTAVSVYKLWNGKYMVIKHGTSTFCIISHSLEGRMLFDGEDIETEAFMAYIGMLDAVNDSPNKAVLFNADMTVVDL